MYVCDAVHTNLTGGLSSKEKSIGHSRDRNIQFIVIKVPIQIDLIKIQVLSKN